MTRTLFATFATSAAGFVLLAAGCASDTAQSGEDLTSPPSFSEASAGDIPDDSAIYTCGSETVTVDYYDERAIVRTERTNYALDDMEAASGAKYGGPTPDGEVIFWSKGDTARLSVAGEEKDICRIKRDNGFDASQIDDITNREWVVEDINNAGIPDRARATLNFESDGNISGRTGCNQYNGSWEIKGDLITYSVFAVTKMACPPALMDMENKFLAVLSEPTVVKLSDNGLLSLGSIAGTIEAR